MPRAPSRGIGSWGLENVYPNSVALRTGGPWGIISVFRQPSTSRALHFSSSHGKDGNYCLFTRGCQNFFLLFLLFISLSFTTGDPGQFQGSYGKFLRCDKDSLGFCSIDFYGTVDGCKIRVGMVQWAARQPGLCRKMGGAGARARWHQEGVCFDLAKVQAQRRRLALARIPVRMERSDSSEGCTAWREQASTTRP